MSRNLTLLTDLYQLTMMNGYLKNGKEKDIAVFDLFFRRNNIISYSVAAGLEQAVEYIRSIRFDGEDIEYLRSLRLFDEPFLSISVVFPLYRRRICRSRRARSYFPKSRSSP